MNSNSSKVDNYIATGCGRCEKWNTPKCKVNNWRNELIELRKIILESKLKEDFKWGMPCYTVNGKNVLVLAAFKNYCAISFFKGALLDDKFKLLHSPGENSQHFRQLRFTSLNEIKKVKSKIKDYIQQAILIEESGLKIEKSSTPKIPKEFEKFLSENSKLKEKFYSLTPGKQRAYLIYFSQPKKLETVISRIQKCIPKIMQGKGLND